MQTKRKLLNSQEAAEYLGLSLSYFRKMMMRRVIPCTSRAASSVSLTRTTLTHT